MPRTLTIAPGKKGEFRRLSAEIVWPWLESQGGRGVGMGNDLMGSSNDLITWFAFPTLQEWYRFARPDRAFAFARVYTAERDLDEALTPADGDVVLVPRGYHPVGMPAGYDGYYLNVMAGPGREWRFTVDPDHAWLMDWTPTTGPDDTTERPR